jgi:hypothetical protein
LFNNSVVCWAEQDIEALYIHNSQNIGARELK